MNCKTCKHWKEKNQRLNESGSFASKEQGGEVAGECRGSTPKFVHGKGGPFRVFPVTIATDWCGSWSGAVVINKPAETETASVSAPAVVVESNAEPKRRGRPPKDSV